mgnify:CR=1 FL=1
MLLLFLVIGILVLIDKKVKKSFIEKYQYIEEQTIGIPMEKEEVIKANTRWGNGTEGH